MPNEIRAILELHIEEGLFYQAINIYALMMSHVILINVIGYAFHFKLVILAE